MTTTIKAGDRVGAAETADRRRGHWFMKFGLLLGTVALSVAFCELAARWLVPQSPSWLAIYRRHPDLPFYGFQPSAVQSVDTGETHWTVFTNSVGDRISASDRGRQGEQPAATPNGHKPWVLCLGDSFLFAHGVDHEQSFVGRLQQDAVGGLGWVNAGVPGYGPVQYRQVLEYRLQRGPTPQRVLIATFLGNDFHDCVWNKDLPVADGILGKRSRWIDTIKQNSHLYRLFARVYHQAAVHETASGPEGASQSSDPWQGDFLQRAEQKYQEEFGRIAELCQQSGIALHVVILPSREEIAGSEDKEAAADAEPAEDRRRARQILDELEIAYVDTTQALGEVAYRDAFFHFDGHLTPQGHEIVYRLLKEVLFEEPSGGRVER
jgi:hypothetical protein